MQLTNEIYDVDQNHYFQYENDLPNLVLPTVSDKDTKIFEEISSKYVPLMKSHSNGILPIYLDYLHTQSMCAMLGKKYNQSLNYHLYEISNFQKMLNDISTFCRQWIRHNLYLSTYRLYEGDKNHFRINAFEFSVNPDKTLKLSFHNKIVETLPEIDAGFESHGYGIYPNREKAVASAFEHFNYDSFIVFGQRSAHSLFHTTFNTSFNEYIAMFLDYYFPRFDSELKSEIKDMVYNSKQFQIAKNTFFGASCNSLAKGAYKGFFQLLDKHVLSLALKSFGFNLDMYHYNFVATHYKQIAELEQTSPKLLPMIKHLQHPNYFLYTVDPDVPILKQIHDLFKQYNIEPKVWRYIANSPISVNAYLSLFRISYYNDAIRPLTLINSPMNLSYFKSYITLRRHKYSLLELCERLISNSKINQKTANRIIQLTLEQSVIAKKKSVLKEYVNNSLIQLTDFLDAVSRDQYDDLLPKDHTFTWVKLTKLVHEYHERVIEQQRPKHNFRYFSLLDDFTFNDVTIRQLANTDEIYHEGKALHHCVYSYDDRCANGTAFIFSMISENSRSTAHFSLDLNDKSFVLIQHRSYCNQKPTKAHSEALKQLSKLFASAVSNLDVNVLKEHVQINYMNLASVVFENDDFRDVPF